jgi:hypothetical protein
MYPNLYLFTSPSSLLTPLPRCAGPGLLHDFATVIFFFGGGSLPPTPNPPTWRTKDYTSSGPLPLTCPVWVALPAVYAPASITLRITGTHKRPLDDKEYVYTVKPRFTNLIRS